MANSSSVFQPVDPNAFTGPFSGFLRPQEPTQATQMAQGPMSTGGGIAAAAASFIEGATKGRIKAYEQRENQKLANLQMLNSYVAQQTNRNDLTEEGKAKIGRMYWQSFGHHLDQAAGKPSGAPQDTHGLFHHAAKAFATGLTGGQTPKGAPDVGNMMLNIQQEIFDADGKPLEKYHLPTQINNVMADAKTKLAEAEAQAKAEGRTLFANDAAKSIGTHLDKLYQLAPQSAQYYHGTLIAPYQMAPAVGTAAYFATQPEFMGPGPGQAPGAPAPNAAPGAAPSQTAPAPAPAGAAPTAQVAYSPVPQNYSPAQAPPAPDLVSGMPRQQLMIQPAAASGPTLQYTAGAAPQYPPMPVQQSPTGQPAAAVGPATQQGAGAAIARPGATGQFDTPLTSQEESQFQQWKSRYAPRDSGADYDLRGAFKAGITPDPQTGHWPDTFKKPNHPTFSNQSRYASAAPDKAGSWGGPHGDQYIPPQTPAGPPQPVGQPPAAGQPAAAQQPAVDKLSPRLAFIASHVPGAMGALQHVGYVDPKTNKQVRINARMVTIPGQNIMGYYDADGNRLPVPASQVYPVSLTQAQPRAEQFWYPNNPMAAPHDMTISGQTIRAGQPVAYRISNERNPDGTPKVEFLGRPTYSPRPPAAGRTDSAAVLALKHKLGVESAIGKIIQQGEERGAWKGLTGPALWQSIAEHARKYYAEDREVQPYLGAIPAYVNQQAKTSNLKENFMDVIRRNAGITQTNLTNAQNEDFKNHVDEKINQVGDDVRGVTMNMWGAQGDQEPPPQTPGMIEIPEQ